MSRKSVVEKHRNAEFIRRKCNNRVSHNKRFFHKQYIFLVPKKGGEHRPVINLEDLNVFLRYKHFKMEGIHLLKDILVRNDLKNIEKMLVRTTSLLLN